MRKKNFCLAVLSASAVLALGASFSSFAAWKSVNSEWVYTDNNGNNVTSAWRSDAEPLDRSACNEDRALKCVVDFSI